MFFFNQPSAPEIFLTVIGRQSEGKRKKGKW